MSDIHNTTHAHDEGDADIPVLTDVIEDEGVRTPAGHHVGRELWRDWNARSGDDRSDSHCHQGNRRYPR